MSDCIIHIDNISMMFNKSKENVDNIKEYFVRLVKRQLVFEEFWALRDVSFSVQRGEALGLVGLNGSGKSTLLKIIAQVMKPTRGSVSVLGSVAPLIELGAGFDPDLSAKENIFLNGAVLGFNRKQMTEKFDSIIEFSELQEFVDMPLKNYSSGMVARLGFSIATASIPDILIVDEVLSVGDYKFKEKCEQRIHQIIENGATVIFVSHSIKQVEEICSRAIWLEKGTVVMDGPAAEVCRNYVH